VGIVEQYSGGQVPPGSVQMRGYPHKISLLSLIIHFLPL